MKKIINLFTLGVFLISNIMTPLTNFIYAEENETLEETGDLAMTRDMGDVADSDENIPETSPEETVDNPAEESNLPAVEPEVQPEEQTEDSSEDLPESTESHNSAVVPVEDNQGEVVNPESQTETDQTEVDQAQQEEIEEKTIEEEIEIMGECSGGQQYNENLDICYTQNTIDNVPVFYGTDMNTEHTYNNNPIGTITVFVPVGDEEVPITMMDMNLGATEPGTSSASYGNHYQWGNSYGFNGTIVKEMSTASYNNYRPGHRYDDSTFRYWTGEMGSRDYWGSAHYKNLWGGAGDEVIDYYSTPSINTYYGGIKNGKNRQGPCPVGYHVPSAEEWNALAVYWYNTKNNPSPQKSYTSFNSLGEDSNFQTTFKLPLAGQYRTGSSTVRNGGVIGAYWTSSNVSSAGDRAYAFYPKTMWMSYYEWKSYGESIRCFKDSSDVIVHTVTFHDSDKRILGSDSGELDQLVADGQTLQEPVVQEGSKILLGWTKTLNGTDYFDFSESVEEDMDLYAKWKDFEFDDLELYFLQNDGTLSHYTIMDRNMRATETYNQNQSNPNSYGYYYQWGDGPSSADNAWGGAGDSYNGNGDGTLIGNDNDWSILSGKQGVCPEGYYIPSNYDWQTLAKAWKNSTSTQYEGRYGGKFASDLLLPLAGYYNSNNTHYVDAAYWSSTPSVSTNAYYFKFYLSSIETYSLSNPRSYKMPIRCAKSSPNNSDFTLHANGGTTTVIAFTGTVGNGKITALGDASSYNGVFDGWYSDEEYQNKVNVGDTVPSDLYAKWSCNQGYIMEGGKCIFPGEMAILIPGEEFNLTLKTLAKGKPEQSVYSGDSLIQGFKWSDSLPENTENIIKISIDRSSDVPVYAWFDTDGYENGKGIIYYTSEADKIYMHPLSSYMFGYMNEITEIDLSNLDTSNVTDMYGMFSNCNNLAEIDVSKFDTSKVTNMSSMFSNCNSLTELDLSKFDTSKVTNMSNMFASCSSLTELDLSNFDTSNVTSMSYMFYFNDYYGDSSNLSTIYASDKFKTNPASGSYYSMFYGATLIEGGQGTTYNSNYTNNTYARIDGGPTSSTPGYFTAASNITYHLDGGELRNAKHAYSPLFAFKLAIPVKEGYTFIGWTGSNGNTPEREVTVPKGTEGDLEYTAHWEINNYKIKFDTVGGDDIDPIEVEYNSSLEGIQLPTPTKGGYKFVGWDKELPETMPAEDITIVASWEQVSQGSYSSGGGSKTSTIDVVKETVDDNTHKAADEKDESKTPDGKEGSNESSDAASVESNNSQEFVEAYNFAKTNGITTQSSIQKAKMNTSLTRIQMAKMLSYYAINVLGQTPDSSKTINFKDVSAKRDAEYDNGVTLAYQLGIMGINMKNNRFRPNDEVTRAEFVTALSRMIYGMKDGTGKMKYYEPHMARLYNEGIINETNPKMKEKRGYVMIMLMRTVQK